jgi:ribosomal protein L37AE/L43A
MRWGQNARYFAEECPICRSHKTEELDKNLRYCQNCGISFEVFQEGWVRVPVRYPEYREVQSKLGV